jgi:hypothetical protein
MPVKRSDCQLNKIGKIDKVFRPPRRFETSSFWLPVSERTIAIDLPPRRRLRDAKWVD